MLPSLYSIIVLYLNKIRMSEFVSTVGPALAGFLLINMKHMAEALIQLGYIAIGAMLIGGIIWSVDKLEQSLCNIMDRIVSKCSIRTQKFIFYIMCGILCGLICNPYARW